MLSECVVALRIKWLTTKDCIVNTSMISFFFEKTIDGRSYKQINEKNINDIMFKNERYI